MVKVENYESEYQDIFNAKSCELMEERRTEWKSTRMTKLICNAKLTNVHYSPRT